MLLWRFNETELNFWTKNIKCCNYSDGSKEGARDARPRVPNTFIFMQFSAKKLVSTPILGVGAPSGKSWIRHWIRIKSEKLTFPLLLKLLFRPTKHYMYDKLQVSWSKNKWFISERQSCVFTLQFLSRLFQMSTNHLSFQVF